jgi:exopolysaccharide biosynthesis polyprenyl glycosylphosphotransferase
MLHAHHRVFAGTIFAIDLVLVTASALASRLLPLSGAELGRVDVWAVVLVTCMSSLTWMLTAVSLDLYHSRRTETQLKELGLLLQALLFTIGMGTIAQLVVLGHIVAEPLAWLILAISGIFVLRVIVRSVLRLLRIRGFNYRQVLVVGYGTAGQVISETIRHNSHYGLRVFGAIPFDGEDREPPGDLRELGGFDQLEKVLHEYTVDAVLLCPSSQAISGQIQRVIELCDVVGTVCHYAPSFLTLRNLAPMLVNYGNTPVFAFRPGPVAPVRLALKRLLDLTASGGAILFLLPVLTAIAIAVKLEDGGPILFKQVRLGRNARPFQCLKFRSMVVDAEKKLAEIAAANEQKGPVFKMKHDPRITRVGRLLRKYSLDELPQLFNVFIGQMSLVGPRPPLPSEVIQYDWWQRRRLSVRPGITCTWQVSGRNQISFEKWMEMDLAYIDQWSLSLDFKLLARTVGTVFRGTGM